MAERSRKPRVLQIVEYAAAAAALSASRAIPFRLALWCSGLLGNLLYLAGRRRRKLAIGNIGAAFAGRMSPGEIRSMARSSCQSLVLTAFEALMLPRLLRAVAGAEARGPAGHLEELFLKIRKIHDESGGCIFVTPHLGNWELLPSVAARVGIPLVVVARPLANPYLEKLLYRSRASSGQLVIPKKNALFVLQRALQRGTSVGLLADQSTMKGLSVDYFGRKATTTPVPAVLAVTKNRPVVVVACCRTGYLRFEGFMSEPIWPGGCPSEKEELFRITREMNRAMEAIVRRHPEQYLWMHDRWKTYAGRKALIEEED